MSFSSLLPSAPLPYSEDDQLDDALQAMVAGITGLPGNLVRPRWQPVPPTEPPLTTNWCAIGTQDETPDASPYIVHLPTDPTTSDPLQQGQDALQRHVRIDVVATFFGPLARTYAGLLRDGLAIDQNRWALTAGGLGVHAIGRAVRMPTLEGMEWRNRVDQMLSFNRQFDRLYPVRNILTAVFVIPHN